MTKPQDLNDRERASGEPESTFEPMDDETDEQPNTEVSNREGATPPALPRITLGPKTHLNVRRSLDALRDHREVFVQGPRVVQVVRNPTGRTIQPVTPEGLQALLSQMADFIRLEKNSKGETVEKHVEPPLSLAKQILAGGSFPRFRQLDGIVTSPILRPNGSLCTERGYDSATRLYLAPKGRFPAAPEFPTQEQAAEAAKSLLEPFREFVFVSEADRAAVVAMILSLIGKPAHDGCTPMFVVTANVRGSGKGKLTTCAVFIALGSVPAVIGWPDAEAERGKRLDTIILGGQPVGLFDNITGVLGSASLDLALTALSYSGRVLGKSLMPVVERVFTVLIGTGNNFTFSGDTARRAVPIRLYSKTSRPEDRTFDIPDLQAHVRDHRAELYTAAMTILRAFILARKPAHGGSLLGSFEGWDGLIRAAVIWAGLPDPLGTRANIDEVDESGTKHAQLVAMLLELFKTRKDAWTTGDLADAVMALPGSTAEGNLTLREARNVLDGLGVWDRAAKRPDNKELGQELRSYADRPDADGRRIIRAGVNRRKVALWKLE